MGDLIVGHVYQNRNTFRLFDWNFCVMLPKFILKTISIILEIEQKCSHVRESYFYYELTIQKLDIFVQIENVAFDHIKVLAFCTTTMGFEEGLKSCQSHHINVIDEVFNLNYCCLFRGIFQIPVWQNRIGSKTVRFAYCYDKLSSSHTER